MERLDQDNYRNLHWSSCCECLLSLVPLADILYCGPDRTQRTTSSSLTQRAAVALQAKKCMYKYMTSHLFLRIIKESGVCILQNVLSWITATVFILCTPGDTFCCICRWKGIPQMSYVCRTAYCLQKCKEIHEAEKTKCKGLTSRTKTQCTDVSICQKNI